MQLNPFMSQTKIINSNINFTKKGWGVQLSIILNLTPQASIKFVKREIPDLYEHCFKHKLSS